MEIFFACLMVKSMNGTTTLKKMWENSKLSSFKITKKISRDKFRSILNHFVLNPYDHNDYKPYDKFMTGLNNALNKFTTLYTAANLLSIDDFRIAANKPHPFYSRINSKPIKDGITCHMLGDKSAAITGNALGYVPYRGKHTFVESLAITPNENKMANYVIQLIENSYDIDECKYNIIFTDSGYTSIYLLEKVSGKYGCKFAGTIKANAKCIPKKFLESNEFNELYDNMDIAGYIQLQCNDIHLTIIKDTKKVMIIDNAFKMESITPIQRYIKKDDDTITYMAPTVFNYYKIYSKSVDKVGFLLKKIDLDFKQRRKYNRVMLRLFQTIIQNSINLFMNCNEKADPIRCLQELCDYYYNKYERIFGNKVIHRPRNKGAIEQYLKSGINANHTICKHDVNNKKKQLRCIECQRHTTYMCSVCTVPWSGFGIGLCNKRYTKRNCFVEYHNSIGIDCD